MTRSELVQVTYLALEFIAQIKLWSFGLQITNHVLGMRPIFNLKPGLHDESQRKWHQLITLILFMNDQHKRCFKFIKDCFSHDDLSHRDSLAADKIKRESQQVETTICTKQFKQDEEQDLSWLWIILNRNIASRITTEGKSKNAKQKLFMRALQYKMGRKDESKPQLKEYMMVQANSWL